MSHLQKSNRKGFLPEITPKNSNKSQIKETKPWETIHIEELPKIPEITWNKELEGKIDKDNIEDGLSLDASLRKSLTLINTFQRHERSQEKSTKFLMLEMNDFFIQMAEELRYLKSNLIHDKNKEIEREIYYNNTYYYGSNKKIKKMFKNIKSIESKIQEQAFEMKIIEEERKEIHDEIRSLIDESLEIKKNKLTDQNFPYYLLSKHDDVTKESKTTFEDKPHEQKPKNKYEKNFIEKNIKLAKNRTMYNSKCSLTDEEKLKLSKLLTDMEEKSEPNPKKYLKSYEEIVDNYNLHSATLAEESKSLSDDEDLEEIGFKLHKKDSKLLAQLNEELQKIDEKKHDLSETISIGFHEEDSKKPWRKQIMEKKLCDIEKNLIQIANERNEENEKTESDLFVPDRDKIEEMRREYYESLEDMKFVFENDETVEND